MSVHVSKLVKVRFALNNAELIPITWHPRRWWNFCMLEDKKKRNRRTFH